MRTRIHISRMTLLGAVTALGFAFTLMAGPREAKAVTITEGEISVLPLNQSALTLNPAPSVASPVHFVSISGAGTNELVNSASSCVTEDGSSIAIYDASCSINGGAPENPCIIASTSFSIVALNNLCLILTTDVPALTAVIPGLAAGVSTSGPSAGCATIGTIAPWHGLSSGGLFIQGGGQSTQARLQLLDAKGNPAGTVPTCATVGEAGIGTEISYPP